MFIKTNKTKSTKVRKPKPITLTKEGTQRYIMLNFLLLEEIKANEKG